ncbi:hypothetical protein QYE76_032852 [Lolium multiflorum]|uniref:Reverse transcriptase Ty1/copia-type domain-containing protein n=1 Tax=Lolium multiflorum TaxID=4521 RepID=A0AAD8QXN0_LOLMU|nr:hypothetical protein QYE76_032852 [Lolium multiflorum]
MSHIPKNKKKALNPLSKTMMMIKKHPQLMFKLKLSLMINFEPLKVHEALVDPDWVIAMQEELECFTRNEVWSLVERPKDHRINVIGTKWVFKNKQDENGIVIRNKARLVAQGFAQIEGGSSDDERGGLAKRGRTAPRPPGCRTSNRKPPKAPQPTDTGSSARGRSKSSANKRKDKQAAQEDDEIVPDFNVADANRLDWQDLRTVNPYRYEQRTYTGGDKFFWTKTQAALWVGYYDNTHECMKNGAVVKPKAINPEELALHEATKYRFVVQTLKGMGLYDLVCLKPDDDQEDPTYCPLLVRQFHCTVFFHDDADRTMTWMTGREKYSCTYTQFWRPWVLVAVLYSTDDDGDEDEGDAAARDDDESSYSAGHEFY